VTLLRGTAIRKTEFIPFQNQASFGERIEIRSTTVIERFDGRPQQ